MIYLIANLHNSVRLMQSERRSVINKMSCAISGKSKTKTLWESLREMNGNHNN